jgi:hypothetical protein
VLGAIALGVSISAGCRVFDAFGPTGPSGVTLLYVGDSVLTAGQPAPFSVSVLAEGVPLPQQRFRMDISPDSTVVTLNAAADTLIPCRTGRADLRIRLIHSSAAGADMPDTAIALRVTGGSPGCP